MSFRINLKVEPRAGFAILLKEIIVLPPPEHITYPTVIKGSTTTFSQLCLEILSNYNLSSSFTLGSIALWIRSNLGLLNNYLGTDYYIDKDSYIYPSITNDHKIVLFKIFEIYYYNKLARDSTGASNYNAYVELLEGVSSVRKINRKEINKTYNRLAKQSQKELNSLINNYAYTNGLAIAGADE